MRMITCLKVRRHARRARRRRLGQLLLAAALLILLAVAVNFMSLLHQVLSRALETVPITNNLPPAANNTAPGQPTVTKIQRFYRYLNMSWSQPSAVLPVTLKSRFLLSNPDLCTIAVSNVKNGNPVDVLFMVHTAVPNFSRRQFLRSSAANQSYFSPFKVRILFLMGLPSNDTNSTLQSLVEVEHSKYGDILQGDFIDTYSNLTHKGVMGYRWISQHCRCARLVAKIDDDVFVDTFKLLHRFWPAVFVGKSRSIFCNIWYNNTMLILREGKWKVEDRLLPHFRFYPWDYCSGMAVFITGDLIPSLFKAAFWAPFFWIDDAYLFGLLPAIVGNVTFYDIGFSKNMSSNSTETLNCVATHGSFCHILATTGSPEALQILWNATYSYHGVWQLPSKRID